MATLTVQAITLAGTTPSYTGAGTSGDEFTNPDGKAFLHVKNGGGSQITVTINSQVPCNYGHDHDITVQVSAGGEKLIGPFGPGRFNDTSGKVQVTYSSTTSVTVAVLSL
jgi:hypothetical protein